MTSNVTQQQTDTQEAGNTWVACLEIIRERVNTQSFKTWFEPIAP
ncbi:MAG: hypothetical protein KAJ12_00840, partial [Bacteroidetes bacterium]|nr:hypothetical protein [Bacteroidota bacterium]